MRLEKKTLFGIMAVVVVAIILILTAYLVVFSTVKVAGIVDHKTITGVRNDTSYTLVVILPTIIDVKDPALDSLFQGMNGSATINETLEQQILNSGYSEIRYWVSIEVSSKDPVNHLDPGDALAYQVKRSDFNALTFGGTVEFEVRKGEPLRIAEVRD